MCADKGMMLLNHFFAYLTLLTLTYVILMELCSLSPSIPTPAGEAQILQDINDKSSKYLVKKFMGTM